MITSFLFLYLETGCGPKRSSEDCNLCALVYFLYFILTDVVVCSLYNTMRAGKRLVP